MGVAGAVALAACGETRIVTKEVPVEKIVTVEKIVEVEAAPQRVTAILRLANDHSSGARGKAMGWALDKFAAQFPSIAIKFEPQDHLYMESFGIHLSAGSQAEMALLDGGLFNMWVHRGGFTQINDSLKKHEAWNPTAWYSPPDEMSITFDDDRAAGPAPHTMGHSGPQFGMPYQGNINGAIDNFTLLEELGIPMPVEGSFHIEREAQDFYRQGTDPESGTFGLRMHPNGWVVWGSWARALQSTGNHMWRSPDALHWDVFNDGGDAGFAAAAKTISDGVAVPLDAIQQTAGEFGDPFSAGKVARMWTGGGVGNTINRIRDRFAWGLGPTEEGDRGPGPHHFTNQGHYITNAADTNGLVEETVEALLFFAGPLVQGRIAVDRGSLPMVKEVVTSPELAAPPPENHGMYKQWMDRDDHHHWQNAHPAWWEWYEAFRAADPAFIGEETPEQTMVMMVDLSDRMLADTKENYDEYRTWVEGLTT